MSISLGFYAIIDGSCGDRVNWIKVVWEDFVEIVECTV